MPRKESLKSLRNMSSSSPNPDANKKHFVLIHGACHGAWCWYKLSALLTSAGYDVTALDLAACGIHPKEVKYVQTFSDYAEPLIKFMETLPPEESVILVGHSFGGPVISIAMEMFPEKILAAVFATAFMPSPTFSYPHIIEKMFAGVDLMDYYHRFDNGPNNPPTSAIFGPKIMSLLLYQLSPPEDVKLASSLLRFCPVLIHDEIKLTNEKYGSVRKVFIVCDQDLIIPEKWQRWMIDENPPNEVQVINGADHMVMFSKPQELFSCLQAIAVSSSF